MLGRFYLGKQLGSGSFGRVLLVKLKTNGQLYALKIIDKNKIVKGKKIQSVMQEKNILTSTSHHFIIKLHYSFKDSDYLYMCFEYAAGGELFTLINNSLRKNQRRGIDEVACDLMTTQFYAAEVSCALEYLHGLGIVHMDLKPENILLTKSGHIKLADFGSAIFSHTAVDAASDLFVGTANYLSPEVLNDGRITTACDLWALGCIIYQMCCGTAPFHAESDYLIFQNIRGYIDGKPLIWPNSVGGAALDLVKCLLRAEASQRPSLSAGAGSSLIFTPPQPPPTSTSLHIRHSAYHGGIEGELEISSNEISSSDGDVLTLLKLHHFFTGVDWPRVGQTAPPLSLASKRDSDGGEEEEEYNEDGGEAETERWTDGALRDWELRVELGEDQIYR